MKKVLIAVAAAAMLTGCGTLSSPGGELAKGYGIMKLTEEAVKGNVEKAEKVRTIAAEVRQYAADAEFNTVVLLMEYLRSRLPWSSMSAADRYFADEVLKLWQEDLTNRYGENVLPENLRLSVEKVTGWVLLAAWP